MCRNIKSLYNFDPPATPEEIRDAALQYIRKISGFRNPSAKNAKAFEAAVASVSSDTQALLDSLTTATPMKNRDVEMHKLHERSAKRFGSKSI